MIQGEQRVQKEYKKRVGLFEGVVIAINPTIEEYKDLLDIELPPTSKVTEYLGKNDSGDTKLRIDVWLKDVKSDDKYKVCFYLEDKEKNNRDNTKKQYINEIGSCAWAEDENMLKDYFTKREYRVARLGEEDLYGFLRVWLGKFDFLKETNVLHLDWKKLMKGNTSELREQINGAYCTTVVSLATIRMKEMDGEMKEFQGVYNGGFLPSYTLKNFRLVNYSDSSVLKSIRDKEVKYRKIHEKFVVDVTGEYGCRDFYTFTDIKDYDSSDNLAASNTVISSDGGDF